MFKFTALCLMAVLACAVARPGVVSPLAYSAYPAAANYVAAPYAAQIGYSPVVAPYASSYNAHQIDHSVAYPSLPYAVAPAAYAAAPAAYAAAPAAYAAAPAAYAAQAAYAAPAYGW